MKILAIDKPSFISGTNGDFICDHFLGIDSAIHAGALSVPMITMRKGATPDSVSDIVFPISMRIDQTQFVVRAKLIQKIFDARLHLLLVKAQAFSPSDIKAKYFVDAFARHYQISNYSSNVITHPDRINKIVDFSLDMGADLILWGMKE